MFTRVTVPLSTSLPGFPCASRLECWRVVSFGPGSLSPPLQVRGETGGEAEGGGFTNALATVSYGPPQSCLGGFSGLCWPVVAGQLPLLPPYPALFDANSGANFPHKLTRQVDFLPRHLARRPGCALINSRWLATRTAQRLCHVRIWASSRFRRGLPFTSVRGSSGIPARLSSLVQHCGGKQRWHRSDLSNWTFSWTIQREVAWRLSR
jgi:hypothetical protein